MSDPTQTLATEVAAENVSIDALIAYAVATNAHLTSLETQIAESGANMALVGPTLAAMRDEEAKIAAVLPKPAATPAPPIPPSASPAPPGPGNPAVLTDPAQQAADAAAAAAAAQAQADAEEAAETPAAETAETPPAV